MQDLWPHAMPTLQHRKSITLNLFQLCVSVSIFVFCILAPMTKVPTKRSGGPWPLWHASWLNPCGACQTWWTAVVCVQILLVFSPDLCPLLLTMKFVEEAKFYPSFGSVLVTGWWPPFHVANRALRLAQARWAKNEQIARHFTKKEKKVSFTHALATREPNSCLKSTRARLSALVHKLFMPREHLGGGLQHAAKAGCSECTLPLWGAVEALSQVQVVSPHTASYLL